MKVLLIILGALLAAMSLMLLLANPIIGIVGIGISVFVIWRGAKYKKKAAPENEAIKEPQAVPAERKAEALASDAKHETIKVAGISFRTDEVRSLGQENPEYDYSKREIIENGLEEEKIYEYVFDLLPAEFVYEPENEYDSNAIAIYAGGVKIGYVKKGSTAHIRKLIESGRLISASCEIYGGKYKYLDPDDNNLEKGETNFGARVTLKVKE